jgi:hypothetical protein
VFAESYLRWTLLKDEGNTVNKSTMNAELMNMPHFISYGETPGVPSGPHLRLGDIYMHFESHNVGLVRAYFTTDHECDHGSSRVPPPHGTVIQRDNGCRSSIIMEPLENTYFLLSRNYDYDVLLQGTLVYRLSDHHTLQVHKYGV